MPAHSGYSTLPVQGWGFTSNTRSISHGKEEMIAELVVKLCDSLRELIIQHSLESKKTFELRVKPIFDYMREIHEDVVFRQPPKLSSYLLHLGIDFRMQGEL